MQLVVCLEIKFYKMKYNTVILFLLIGVSIFTGCKKMDNTGRIRPVGMYPYVENEEDETPIEHLAPFTYNLTKDGSVWKFPATTKMGMEFEINIYGDTVFTVLIDNSFTRNDTIYKDKLEIKFKNLRYNDISYTVGGWQNTAQATYYSGNQFKSSIRSTQDPMYSPYLQSTIWTQEQISTRKKVSINLYLIGSTISQIKGTFEFAL